MIKFQLEKYHGTKSRLTCPQCGCKNVFARYIDAETGEHLGEIIGRCNRESKCGYHFTPKMFCEQNPQLKADFNIGRARTPAPHQKTPAKLYSDVLNYRQPDYIDFSVLRKTLTSYERNPFACFLLDLFPEDQAIVRNAISEYFVGTTKTGKTVFWQIDDARRIRTGKIIAYDESTGKRVKQTSPGWVHAELKKQKLLAENFNLTQCFFGEHLLRNREAAPVAITEAEKTAVIASICFPEFVWIATGSKQSLKAEKLAKFKARKIILYPDADGFEKWRETAQEAKESGLTVHVSDLIEKYASGEERENGYDLADYLVSEQRRINNQNSLIDDYNHALDKVLNDESLLESFNDLYDERLAIMETQPLPESEIRELVKRVSD